MTGWAANSFSGRYAATIMPNAISSYGSLPCIAHFDRAQWRFVAAERQPRTMPSRQIEFARIFLSPRDDEKREAGVRKRAP
jgi:hypothetical protein